LWWKTAGRAGASLSRDPQEFGSCRYARAFSKFRLTEEITDHHILNPHHVFEVRGQPICTLAD
jgi:hypothetical protein